MKLIDLPCPSLIIGRVYSTSTWLLNGQMLWVLCVNRKHDHHQPLWAHLPLQFREQVHKRVNEIDKVGDFTEYVGHVKMLTQPRPTNHLRTSPGPHRRRPLTRVLEP